MNLGRDKDDRCDSLVCFSSSGQWPLWTILEFWSKPLVSLNIVSLKVWEDEYYKKEETKCQEEFAQSGWIPGQSDTKTIRYRDYQIQGLSDTGTEKLGGLRD